MDIVDGSRLRAVRGSIRAFVFVAAVAGCHRHVEPAARYEEPAARFLVAPPTNESPSVAPKPGRTLADEGRMGAGLYGLRSP
jgi:hypothetical protein